MTTKSVTLLAYDSIVPRITVAKDDQEKVDLVKIILRESGDTSVPLANHHELWLSPDQALSLFGSLSRTVQTIMATGNND